jgi:ribosomal protein L11 methyltransferase
MAFLGELPFDSFEEKDYGLDAFIPLDLYDQSVENQIVDLQNKIQFTLQKQLIKTQNWNAVWESNFDPLVVDDFCSIRADFHDPIPNMQHEIIINPKMAFGTGHHETTFMMIQSMKNIDFNGKKVLDYGCGTGILAILASKLGAQKIDAVDIEIESFENTIENTRNNAVANVNAIHGTLENIEDSGYEIILANINRNVILDTMEALYEKLVKNGRLIVSGILKQDENGLLIKAENIGFLTKNTIQRNHWVCCYFEK